MLSTYVQFPPRGGTPTCKWRGWSKEGKTQHPKKSLSLPTLPKKIPGPKIAPKKIPCQITPKLPGGAITLVFVYSSFHKYAKAVPNHFSLFLITKKIPYLNQVTQKNLPNLLTQKNPRIENFKPKKILRSSPSFTSRSTPLGISLSHIFTYLCFTVVPCKLAWTLTFVSFTLFNACASISARLSCALL